MRQRRTRWTACTIWMTGWALAAALGAPEPVAAATATATPAKSVRAAAPNPAAPRTRKKPATPAPAVPPAASMEEEAAAPAAPANRARRAGILPGGDFLVPRPVDRPDCAPHTLPTSDTTVIARWLGDRPCALSITFDDNGETRRQGAALLEAAGFRGTFNVITMDLKEHRVRTLFTELHARGHELGSHTVRHKMLRAGMAPAEVDRELAQSQRDLQAFTGVPCVSFTYPGGVCPPETRAIAAKYYLSSRTVAWGVNAVDGADLQHLGASFLPTRSPFTREQRLYALDRYLAVLGETGGWGTEIYHNLGAKNDLMTVTSDTLATHLQDLVAGKIVSDVWVAPQGTVARYLIERTSARISTRVRQPGRLVLDLECGGDPRIFDCPLTLLTPIPQNWLGKALLIRQDGRTLAHKEFRRGSYCITQYDALPDRGPIQIACPGAAEPR